MTGDVLAVAMRAGVAAIAVVPETGTPYVHRTALREATRASRIGRVVRLVHRAARDYDVAHVVAEPMLAGELGGVLPTTPLAIREIAAGSRRPTLRVLFARVLREHPELERYLPRLRTGEVALCSRRVRVAGVALLLGLAARRLPHPFPS